MSFPLTPSLSGGYQQVPNPQPQTPVPSPVKLPLSLTLGTSRIPLTFGPSRDGEYHLFISSPPTNPNPLPSPESPDTEGSHCPPRRPLFMRCTDGRYYPQVCVPTARKPLKYITNLILPLIETGFHPDLLPHLILFRPLIETSF